MTYIYIIRYLYVSIDMDTGKSRLHLELCSDSTERSRRTWHEVARFWDAVVSLNMREYAAVISRARRNWGYRPLRVRKMATNVHVELARTRDSLSRKQSHVALLPHLVGTMTRAARVRFAMYCSVTVLLLPVFWIILFFRSPSVVQGISLGMATSFLFVTGRWDLLSYWLRYISIAMLFTSAIYRAEWWLCLLTFTFLLVMWRLVRRAARIAVVQMDFPMRGGAFYIAQGGATSLSNRHHQSRSQHFALDIVTLNWLGARARGIYPSRLEWYRVFGQHVYSPCAGVVVATRSDLPDLPPSQVDEIQLAGNHILIKEDRTGIYVGLAHLMKGSVTIKLGQHVKAGERVARVGNSGNTTEPHLHIHAKRGGNPQSMLDGEGVPICFRGRWLIRNSVFIIRDETSATSRPAIM